MAPLLQLVSAGYHFGHGSTIHGWDSTVSSLECALTNLDEDKGNAFAAAAYSENAIKYLEARLLSAYVISSLAAVKAGNLDLAEEEYGRAVLLATLTVKGQCKPPTIDWPTIRMTLRVVESKLKEAGKSVQSV
ncbi:MAG: hypothetical protein K2Y39_20225 [Candidatus Obscuribacterales bacterium]|nr:hypothetical protein [Candidatus Obscuribacterales bacterium]